MQRPDGEAIQRGTGEVGAPLPGREEGRVGEGPLTFRRKRSWLSGVVPGALAGLLLGGLAGAGVCWVEGEGELWLSALSGALLGPFGGGLVGLVERAIRSPLTRADAGTITGVLYGVVPGFSYFTGGPSVPHLISLHLFGVVLAGALAGLLLGALVDRAEEARQRKALVGLLKIGFVVLLFCAGLGWLMSVRPFGPDPAFLAEEARAIIVRELRKDPETAGVMIRKIALTHRRRGVYRGFMECSIDGEDERLDLTVTLVEDNILVEWKPAGE